MGWALPASILGAVLAALGGWLTLRWRTSSAARRELQARSAVLRGALVEVRSMARLGPDRTARLSGDADAGPQLAAARAAGLTTLVELDLTLTPSGASPLQRWDPARLSARAPGQRSSWRQVHDSADASPEARLLRIEAEAPDGELRPVRGGHRTGPARLRLVVAHGQPPPRLALGYLLETVGDLDLAAAEAPRPVPAALRARAQAFAVSEIPVATPASEPPAEERPNAWQFPCDVRFDVLAPTRERFDPPPIEGLDAAALSPVPRAEAPARFDLSPPGPVDPALLDRLSRTGWAYGVHVETTRPDGLGYLAEALTAASSLAREVGGIIHDVHAGRLSSVEDARAILKADAFRIADHVVADGSGARRWTRGLAKFGRADLELSGVPTEAAPIADEALLALADHLAQGKVFSPGEIVRLGGVDLEIQEGTTRGSRYGTLAVCSPGAPDAAPWLTRLLTPASRQTRSGRE